MNKTAIKNYAIWARVQLIESAKQRAYEYEITENGENNPNLETIGGRLLSKTEKEQRQQLINQIRQKSYTQVMEETAYTWFNRFIALRFMEVNGYLPSKVRVFTDENNAFKPEILKEAMSIELEGLDRNLVLELLDKQDNETLYKALLIAQCNALNTPLPYMFERISNWTELLFPANLLRQDSVIGTMISAIPEEDWTDAVQIIGWLYQYYNSELKDETFALLKKNVKITKERIPAATQLFTPDWIVRYMVENSLGRLWYEGHKDFDKSGWKYYLDEAEQEPEVEQQLQASWAEKARLKPEEIKVIDPCMGSGHILVYAFDVLMQIYTAAGWSERDAAQSIIKNNLYGLDIDERAAQLAYFAVMMKARQYDRQALRRGIQPHVYPIQESNDINRVHLNYLGQSMSNVDRHNAIIQINYLLDTFKDAKEYGSILQPQEYDWQLLDRFIEDTIQERQMSFEETNLEVTQAQLQIMIAQCQILVQQYHVVVTNPPYVAAKGMTDYLSNYLLQHFEEGKMDLFAAFILRAKKLCKKNYYIGLLTPFVWMSILSYESLRAELIRNARITSLIQLEYNAFPEACVPVCTFTLCNSDYPAEKGSFIKLSEFKGSLMQEPKALEAINDKNCSYRFSIATKAFTDVPGLRIAYWATKNNIAAYRRFDSLSDVADVRKGMSTADDKRFLRLWHEISISKFDVFQKNNPKWYRLNKGGSLRRWYGNNNYVVNWENNGYEMKKYPKAVIRNEGYYFRENALTWTYITNYKLNVRFYERAVFSAAGPCIFPNAYSWQYILGLLNSSVAQVFADNTGGETMTYEVGEISTIPVADVSSDLENKIQEIVNECVELSKEDWDSFETSWDFKRHPLLRIGLPLISDAYEEYKKRSNNRFMRLKKLEEDLNSIFAAIYEMTDDINTEVALRDVTTHFVFDNEAQIPPEFEGSTYILTRRDVVVSLISYAIGCMFGRYSLDSDGLCFAGGEWNTGLYKTIIPDADNIIPITDDDYFEDDFVARLINFIDLAFGKENLNKNLKFIADSLGGKGTPIEVIRKYCLERFYQDHCSTYSIVGSGQRPIYWMFKSGKKNGFAALIYIHRYKPDTLARIRTDYVHELQSRYRTAIEDYEQRINLASTSERIKLTKQLSKIKAQAEEVFHFEEQIHHLADQMIEIDLDNGIKQNYELFGDVLAKIK